MVLQAIGFRAIEILLYNKTNVQLIELQSNFARDYGYDFEETNVQFIGMSTYDYYHFFTIKHVFVCVKETSKGDVSFRTQNIML